MKKIVISTLIFCFLSCDTKRELPDIKDKVLSPIDMAVSQDQKYFLALNANLNHSHNHGSIQVISRDGSQLQSYPVRRLGRSIKVAGNRVLVTFDREAGLEGRGEVRLYELEAAEGETLPKLTLKKSWSTESCRPLNSAIRTYPTDDPEGRAGQVYPYFAVACESGSLYLGHMKEDLTQSTMVKARKYPGFVRRAMHLDTRNNLLFGFVTDVSTPGLRDALYEDSKTWDIETDSTTDASNDTPDYIETSKKNRRNVADYGSPYQYFIVELNEASGNMKDGDFIYRPYRETYKELRWLYFNLHKKDGSLEKEDAVSEVDTTAKNKFYRTNFWDAYPDNDKSATFFLSHRGVVLEGSNGATLANNIVKVTIKLDPQMRTQDRLEDEENYKFTHQIFSFSRIYGYQDQKTNQDYIGGIGFIKGDANQDLLLVNHFRSRVEFQKEYFAIKVFPYNPEPAETELGSGDLLASLEVKDIGTPSYYQFAASGSGAVAGDSSVYILTCSFYEDALKLLKLENGALTLVKTFK